MDFMFTKLFSLSDSEEKAARELNSHLEEWVQTPMGRKAFIASLPLLIAACSTTGKGRMREGDNSGQETVITFEDEKSLTREAMPQIQKEYPPLENPKMQTYIQNLGQKIVAANRLNGNPYTYNFSVVKANFINAFALPAGTVMVTVPLIAMAESEAELAGVVGHEIGHVKARHAAERMDKAKQEQGKTWAYVGAGGIMGAAGGFLAGKALCGKGDTACLVKATGLGAAAGAAGGYLVRKFAFMANSREDEMEADRIGFNTSLAAGFDKDHIGRFYNKLYEMEKESKGNQNPLLMRIGDALSTHPNSGDRVAQMQEMTAGASNRPGAIVSSPDFDSARAVSQDWTAKLPAPKS